MKKPIKKAAPTEKNGVIQADLVIQHCTITGATETANTSSVVALANALKAMAEAAGELARNTGGNAVISFKASDKP